MPPAPPSNKYPINPDFSWIQSENDRVMIKSAYQAVSNLEGWDKLSTFQQSFMFTKDQEIIKICDKVNELYGQGHSGSSMAYTMRVMQYIAKNGFDMYRNNHNP